MTTRGLIGFTASLALGLSALAGAAPAQARDHDRDWGRYDQRWDQNRGYDRYQYRDYDRGDRYGRYPAGYDRRDYRYDRSYRDCRSDGTAGTLIGAIAGGLIGNSVASRHDDRTATTIIGGAVGALAGRAIDKSDDRCR